MVKTNELFWTKTQNNTKRNLKDEVGDHFAAVEAGNT